MNKLKRWKRWDKEEIEFLKNNYKIITDKKLAQALGRTYGSVIRKKYKLKLNKTCRWDRGKIIKELLLTAKTLGKSPTVKGISPNLYQACLRYFGSFNKAKQKAGLKILKPKGYKLPKSARRPSIDFCYILGVIHGDGFTTMRKNHSSQIGLVVKDKDFAIEFKDALERWSHNKARFYKDKRGFYITNFYSKEAVKIIREFHLEKIHELSNKKICAFLRGLYDSEGHVAGSNLNIPHKAVKFIGFYNSDKRIINIVSLLLNNLGISHSIKSRIHSGFKSKKTQYELISCGFNNFILFYKNIGFSIKRKKVKLESILNSYVKKSIKTYIYQSLGDINENTRIFNKELSVLPHGKGLFQRQRNRIRRHRRF